MYSKKIKILITGGCGFVGSNLCIFLKNSGFKVFSLDNLSRKGSEINKKRIEIKKNKNFKFDISDKKKIKLLPKFDFIIDCCAEPSVEASRKSSKDAIRVFKTNLEGTLNILLKCNKDKSNIIFLSSSRAYSINSLNKLNKNKNIIKNPLKIRKSIGLKFDTSSPKTLYGFTKLASEDLIREFSYANNIKYIVNRCGVITGPWQMGKVDQGFVSFFVWNILNKRNIKFIGYGGHGYQERDLLHIDDLNQLIKKQIKKFNKLYNKSYSVGGGIKNLISLKLLKNKIEKVTGNKIKSIPVNRTSIYDIPYFLTEIKAVKKLYNWSPKKNINNILNDIYNWQVQNYKLLKKIFK